MTRTVGSYKKFQTGQVAKIIVRMDARDRDFLKEAREGDRYPAREHEAVDRACEAIEKEIGIIVRGEAKLLLYAVHERCVAWILEDQGLNGLYGLASTRRPGRAKRRNEIFRYLKTSFEEAAGKPAPMACNERAPFFRFCKIALSILAPHAFKPRSDKALAKAIENSSYSLKKRHGPLSRLIKWRVTYRKIDC